MILKIYVGNGDNVITYDVRTNASFASAVEASKSATFGEWVANTCLCYLSGDMSVEDYLAEKAKDKASGFTNRIELPQEELYKVKGLLDPSTGNPF